MKLSKLFLFALLSVFCLPKNAPCQTEGNPVIDVIVIGAGISGLAAAKTLQDKDIRVLVLEGRDRIGGRIWTDRSFDGQALDLGASWIHGTRRNPISKIANTQKFHLKNTDYENGDVFLDGKMVSEKKNRLYDRFAGRVLGEALSLSLRGKKKDMQAICDSVSKYRWFSELTKREIDFLLNVNIEHEYAADAKDLSSSGVVEGESFFGPDAIFTKGYDQVTFHLAKDLKIHLKQVVSKIDYSKKRIVITTKAGKKFTANRVILTVPLGVLQKNVIEFSPNLSEEKMKAIGDLGMGTLNKLYLKFPKNFWTKKSSPEIINIVPKTKGRWAEWLNIDHYSGEPILLGFNAGSYGKEIEKMTDYQVVEDAMSVLRQTYGKEIPNPTHWLVTRWNSDPFSFGSYSFAKSSKCVWARRVLAKPVDQKLFFAGEATSSDYPATVHGAYLSGIREAKKILDINQFQPTR